MLHALKLDIIFLLEDDASMVIHVFLSIWVSSLHKAIDTLLKEKKWGQLQN